MVTIETKRVVKDIIFDELIKIDTNEKNINIFQPIILIHTKTNKNKYFDLIDTFKINIDDKSFVYDMNMIQIKGIYIFNDNYLLFTLPLPILQKYFSIYINKKVSFEIKFNKKFNDELDKTSFEFTYEYYINTTKNITKHTFEEIVIVETFDNVINFPKIGKIKEIHIFKDGNITSIDISIMNNIVEYDRTLLKYIHPSENNIIVAKNQYVLNLDNNTLSENDFLKINTKKNNKSNGKIYFVYIDNVIAK
jgi:hypothetical protein